MQKKILCLVLTLTIVCLAESSPISLGFLKFDNLDTDIADLKYEEDDETLEKIFDVTTEGSKKKDDKTRNASESKHLGFIKKNIIDKGHHGKLNEGDLKQFFKKAKVHDYGRYGDGEMFAITGAIAATAAADTVKATRTFRKGNKTRGFHRVQHKDEYKKDQEFFEDDETKGTISKAATKGLSTKARAGAAFNKGFFKDDGEEDILAKEGYLNRGFEDTEDKDLYNSQGYEESFSDERL
uniref:Uncharacterized protein n=1 Tax=Heliothis virescens TaxID=7102 RepID=A0A2A4K669_HELVI